MGLDCTTPRGKIYIEHQMECARRLSEAWNVEIFSTAENGSADIDGIAIKNKKISAVMEIKSREMDLEQLKKFGSYLITFEKILKIRNMATGLGVPGLLVVHLIKDKKIAYWKICDGDGNLLVNLEGKISQTQTTCNGGQIDRYNAYLSLDDMKFFG